MNAPARRAAAADAAGGSTTTGIVLGVMSWGLFALHDATIKWLVADLPAWEILFGRSLLIVVACLCIGRVRLIEQMLASRRKRTLLAFGAVNLVGWLLYYSAARYLPLAQLLTLYFASPIMVTVLAYPLLGERVTAARWLCVGIGFAGVLVASDPFGLSFSLPAGLVLVAAAMWGLGMILMRKMTPSESSMLQMFTMNLAFVIATGMMTLVSAAMPTTSAFLLLALLGVVGGVAQYLLFEAARFAPAAVLGTTEYSALLWAFALGYVIWGDIPATTVFAGAGLIALAGAVLVVTERRAASVDRAAAVAD